jgi:pyridoxal phosphate enzyme (YggS family)
MDISQNIEVIEERLKNAALKSGRKREDIILVAVSKTQPLEKLIMASNCGLNVFGENKVQELTEKYPGLPNASWHLIGHLQRNKVKYIIDKVDLIHSLDNIELAEEIDKRAAKINRIMPVLIQINIGREDSKSGIFEEEIESFSEKIQRYNNILVSGIMAIPPVSDNKDETRIYFRRMKEIFEKVKEYKYGNFNIKYLSMGMTGDFEIAVEEGANIVRVGTGIFGERNYNRGE